MPFLSQMYGLYISDHLRYFFGLGYVRKFIEGNKIFFRSKKNHVANNEFSDVNITKKNIEDGQMYRLLIPDILNEKAFKLFDPVHNILTGNFTNFEPSK